MKGVNEALQLYLAAASDNNVIYINKNIDAIEAGEFEVKRLICS